MASHSANRAESIKLPASQHTYTIHFPGSAGEKVTSHGPNLRAFAAYRENWELSKRVINQSKIRWVNKHIQTIYIGMH